MAVKPRRVLAERLEGGGGVGVDGVWFGARVKCGVVVCGWAGGCAACCARVPRGVFVGRACVDMLLMFALINIL